MVTQGHKVVDVGCDHGFLDIYLLQSGRAPGAIAMDVRGGPLSSARAHIREAGLEDRIETRLSDGLEHFHTGEAQTMICAGMGGPLMQRILTDYPEKTESLEELILQPQSELREFRQFLRNQGYSVGEENIVWEDGKYYFPMKVTRTVAKEPEVAPELLDLYDRFGRGLLERREPLLLCFMEEQERILGEVLCCLGEEHSTDGRREKRRQEIREELASIQRALEWMGISK